MSRNFTRADNDDLKASSTPVTAAPFTISSWSKTDTDTTTDDYCIVQLQDDGASNSYFRMNADGSGSSGVFSFGAAHPGGSLQMARSSVIPTVGTWYNVVGVERTINDREVFVDGGNSGTNTSSRTPTNIDSVAIGRELDTSAADSWDGDIAEVAIWNVALTNAEIAILAAGYSPLFVRPQNLVMYIPLIRDNDNDIVGGVSFAVASGSPAIGIHPSVIRPNHLMMPPIAVAAPPAGAIMNQFQWANLGADLFNGTLL